MKYFVTSDIHGFYSEFKASLDKAGFDLDNPEHIFILCGDLCDRGEEAVELYNFIRYKIPKERRLLIRGNHEYLLKELLYGKAYPESHDFSNKTVQTVLQFANMPDAIKRDIYYSVSSDDWFAAKDKVRDMGLVDWIFGDEWVNYYELGNYVFVHSFIPLNDDNPAMPAYFLEGHRYSYDPTWRNKVSALAWEDASWGCPYRLFDEGLFDEEKKQGKVLVCGHWHASDFHYHYENASSADHSIYYGENLIAIDACTALSHKSNILVIDELSRCLDGDGNELKVREKRKVDYTIETDM